jgi:hypothetical protein
MDSYDINNDLDCVITCKNFDKLITYQGIKEYWEQFNKEKEFQDYTDSEKQIIRKISQHNELIKVAGKEIEWRTIFIDKFIDEKQYLFKDSEIERYKKEIEFQDSTTLINGIKTHLASRNKAIWDKFGYSLISFFDGLDFIATKADLNNYFSQSECHAGSPSYAAELCLALRHQSKNISQLKIIENPTETEQLQKAIIRELAKYGFDSKYNHLIKGNSVPYNMALLHEVGFLNHLLQNHFITFTELDKKLASIFNAGIRVIKGNRLVLGRSNEDRNRYTSHLYSDEIKEIISKI